MTGSLKHKSNRGANEFCCYSGKTSGFHKVHVHTRAMPCHTSVREHNDMHEPLRQQKLLSITRSGVSDI